MAQVARVNDGATSGYAQVLAHLESAKMVASQLGDSAAVAMIAILQNLCLARSGPVDDPTRTTGSSDRNHTPLISLSVYMFGAFQAFLHGSPINGWRKKSEALFKYLVVHRTDAIHRDRLLDLFWPDADPPSARNCLNVTMHALRRGLELASGSNPAGGIIQFANDCYHFHSDFGVWTDTDAFIEYVARAQAAARHGDRAGAITQYELAATLYRGDFLEDDRYEEWTISSRERLRSSYIALLTHLSRLYFEAGNYMSALDCSRKILDRDNCCEEAHCQIMRCYHALGQRGLAVRQYFISRDTLDRELGVPPMEATTRLYEQIKNG